VERGERGRVCKQILRLVVKEVILDQRPESGQVWIRIIWQTGAVSEHKIRRNVNSYRNYADVATLEARVRDLVVARKIDREIARGAGPRCGRFTVSSRSAVQRR
jgi:hypothetical protein